jgi:hypothetical protein
VKYTAVFEPTDTGFSVYVPDLPGCISTGATRDEAECNISSPDLSRPRKLPSAPMDADGSLFPRDPV